MTKATYKSMFVLLSHLLLFLIVSRIEFLALSVYLSFLAGPLAFRLHDSGLLGNNLVIVVFDLCVVVVVHWKNRYYYQL